MQVTAETVFFHIATACGLRRESWWKDEITQEEGQN